jgi:hypothetical protein
MIAGRWLDRAALDQGLLVDPRFSFMWATMPTIAVAKSKEVEARAAKFAHLMDSLPSCAHCRRKCFSAAIPASADWLSCIRMRAVEKEKTNMNAESR